MPSVPIAMPSEMVGTPKSWGLAPASLMDFTATSASGCSPALHGVIVE